MATGKAHIKKEMLKWARQETGLSPQAAAEAAGISGVKGKTGGQRIEEWETTDVLDVLPTKNQLASLAKAYVQPTVLFYLPGPPAQDEVLPDFRKLNPDEQGMSPRLKSLVAKMRARQDEVIDILAEDEEEQPEPLPFIGRFSLKTPLRHFVTDLRSTLGVSEADQRSLRDNDALFRLLRTRAEDLGIYIIVQGDLGSYHSSIDPNEFRGFCLADPIAPFIVLNSYDAKPAQSFTLIHELAHLWMNESGISNANPFNGNEGEAQVESFCNKVASHFLMPPASLLAAWRVLKGMDLYRAVGELARDFSVSRRAVAYRLRMHDELSFNDWKTLSDQFQRDWETYKAKQKEGDGGPSRYTLQKYQLGKRFVGTILGALDAGSLGYTSASRILGVPSKGFSKIRPEGL
mgnify:CR=1 FL=1